MSTAVVGQQVLERGVGRQPNFCGERGRPIRIEIRGCDQMDLRMGQDVARVSAGDVARADDADAERGHGRRLRQREAAARPIVVCPRAMRHDQIALQLYTVRALAAVDLAGTLRAVAAAGYRVGRAGGPSRHGTGRARATPDRDGLRPIASHESIERLRADRARSPTALSVSAATGPSCRGSPRRIAARPMTCANSRPSSACSPRTLGGRGIRLALSQPRFRVRPARRDDGVGHPPRRAPGRGRARAGRLLGVRRRA